MTYRERREARAERLRGWAAGRETKAAAAYDRSREIGDLIPFGQPILVGHHSEGRHRRDIARIDRAMSASVEHTRKAESMSSRAGTIESQLAHAIYSDDPDAIAALEARIAALEAERERVKAYNASARRGAPNLALIDAAQRADLIGTIRVGFAGGKNGNEFPPYVLSNLGGNIKRNKDRLTILRRRAGQSRRRTAAPRRGHAAAPHRHAHGGR